MNRPKIVPQVRAILRSFPEVTWSPRSMAGPMTAPIRPASSMPSSSSALSLIRSGAVPIHNKAQLIAALNEKLRSFPGVTFNYTQPAEDAVDEAETGLKSALAVKVFGPDLNTWSRRAGDQGRCWSRSAVSRT